MDGLNNRQESALARIWIVQDSLPEDFTDWGITDDLVVLRDCGMIDMQTDMSHTLAFVRRLLPEGRNHYKEIRRKRRSFVSLGDSADELIGLLVADCDRKGGDDPLEYYKGRVGDYRNLCSEGLLKVIWADNEPYHVQVTDRGRQYVEGVFPKEDQVLIDFHPVVQGGTASANASSSATVSATVTLGMTIGAIIDLDIDDAIKEEAQMSLRELDEAAKSKDGTSFAEKLERAASIAKSVSALAGVMIPFLQTAIQNFLS